MELFTFDGDAALAGARVVGLRGSESISQPYRYELFLNLLAGADPALDAVMGTRAVLTVHDGAGAPRDTVEGVLRAAEWVEGNLLRVELVPAPWLLSLGRHSRVWVDRDFPSILDEVLRGAGLGDRDFAVRLRGRYRPIAHVCQYRESDLAFVQRWCEQLGITWFFEHDGSREKAVFVDTSDDFARRPAEPVDYYATTADDTSTVEAFRTFSQLRKASPATARVRDYNDVQPSMTLDETADVPVPGEGAMVWTCEDDGEVPGVARRAARLRAELLGSQHELFQGDGRAFGLHPGFTFELEGHPRGGFNREYLVTDVEVRGNALADGEGTPELRAILGPRPWRVTARGIRKGVEFRAPRVTPVPRIDGAVIGHVDGPVDDEYAQLDEHGRYLVKLAFDENSHQPGRATTRIRMLQPHAGAPEGHHFPLRKGTEVLVVFVGGDPDRPVIAAAAPDADTPSPVTSANHTQNVIHTGGNSRIEIEDMAGGQYVDISTPPQNTFIHLGAHHGGHAHNSIASTDGTGHIHQGTDQDITVDSNKTEDVTGAVDERYSSTQTTTVLGDVTETYHATQTTTVDAHCQETYKSHTTVVTGHKIERCTSQYTEVGTLLTETHGTQDTVVDGLLKSTCATRDFKATTQSAQFYDNLTWNVGAGGFTVNDDSYFFVDAPNYTVLVPEVTEVQNVHTEASPSKWFVCEPSKVSRDTVKISMINATLAAIGVKLDATGASIGYTSQKTGMLGFKLDLSGFKMESKMTEQCSGAFHNGKWALKIWL